MTDEGLTADESQMLATLLDVVLPPTADGRLRGGGALGLGTHVERTVRETPMLQPVVAYGLGALAELATKRDPAGWAALSSDARAEVFREFASADQFFLPAFLYLAYSAYYQDPRVVEALGLEARAPHPKGYTMAPDDWSVLEPVRARGKMFRE